MSASLSQVQLPLPVEENWGVLTAATPPPLQREGPVKGATFLTECWTSQTAPQGYTFPSFLGLYGQQPANQVIIRERYRDNDSDLALGMLAGAATGMALGSLFWVF